MTASTGAVEAVTFAALTPAGVEARAAELLALGAGLAGDDWTADNLRMDLPDKWRLSFAAWAGGGAVGYVILSRKSSELIHLHRIVVAPAHRGRGHGARMMAEAERRARAARAARLTLKVAAENRAARRFYARLGYGEDGADGAYLLLGKRLAAPQRARVAIHQPNYLPWLGFFHKMAACDVFVFLDDAQFPKGSYTNRTRILGGGRARWLTLPVRARLGQAINQVVPARADWAARHLDTLATFYADTEHYAETMAEIAPLLRAAPRADLAAINMHLIRALARRLGLDCRFETASSIGTATGAGDDRLVALTQAVAPGGTYVSGRGGATYQDPAKFAAAGIELRPSGFADPAYPQGAADFVPGLSVVDALCRVGWDASRRLVVEG